MFFIGRLEALIFACRCPADGCKCVFGQLGSTFYRRGGGWAARSQPIRSQGRLRRTHDRVAGVWRTARQRGGGGPSGGHMTCMKVKVSGGLRKIDRPGKTRSSSCGWCRLRKTKNRKEKKKTLQQGLKGKVAEKSSELLRSGVTGRGRQTAHLMLLTSLCVEPEVG